jgi:hypothetical protein
MVREGRYFQQRPPFLYGTPSPYTARAPLASDVTSDASVSAALCKGDTRFETLHSVAASF